VIGPQRKHGCPIVALHSNAVYHWPIKNKQFPIVAGTDGIENKAALLLHCIATLFTMSSLQALQFQNIILNTLYFGRLYAIASEGIPNYPSHGLNTPEKNITSPLS
jgi:hypothetical protein